MELQEQERKLFKAIMNAVQNFHQTQCFGPLRKSSYVTLTIIRESSNMLAEAGDQGVTLSYLSDLLCVSRPAVTRMVNMLEEQGLVSKSGKGGDKRRVYVSLTPAGENLLQEGEKIVLESMHEVSEALGEEDTEEFIRMCHKISAYYTKKRLDRAGGTKV